MTEQKLDEALRLVKEHYMPDEDNLGRAETALGAVVKVDEDVWWLMRAMQIGIGHCVLSEREK